MNFYSLASLENNRCAASVDFEDAAGDSKRLFFTRFSLDGNVPRLEGRHKRFVIAQNSHLAIGARHGDRMCVSVEIDLINFCYD